MIQLRKFIYLFSLLLLVACTDIKKPDPKIETTQVYGDADECSFWIDQKNPQNSVLIGNDKSDIGALYVWDLDGNLIYKTETINRPVGVDVRYKMQLNNREVDIVVCGVRSANELKVFKIDPNSRTLIDITTRNKIFTKFSKDTYGIALYKRKSDGEIFAFVSSKKRDDIHQIQLRDDGKGKVKGIFVRSFGKKDQKSFVEGMVVDDELGFLYCSDEKAAILKYLADPKLKDNALLSRFALGDGIKGDREGLGLYKKDLKTGYLVLSSQGNSEFKIYKRESNNAFLKTIKPKGVKYTDGIAITSQSIEPNFSKGIIACHNGPKKNFVMYDWNEFFQSSIDKKKNL